MRNKRKVRTGIVASAKMDKTIVVAVERTMKHPQYGKIIKSTSRIYAHDEENQATVGDTVRIVESRPISRNKRWVVQEIVKTAAD